MLKENSEFLKGHIHSCMQLNISSCTYTEGNDFILAIYNPLSQNVVTPIRIPVQEDAYTVVDLAGNQNG